MIPYCILAIEDESTLLTIPPSHVSEDFSNRPRFMGCRGFDAGDAGELNQ